jgi:hypothetical protein
MLMVLDMADRHGWDNLSLWKMDLQGAFNLLWFDPAVVPIMAFPLAHDLVAFHLVGLFGWAGMPFAFQVLTRALHVLVSARITGVVRWYVDDCMGCSPTATLNADLAAAHSAITALAGDAAVASDKTEVGRQLEFIGWDVCLAHRTVTVSERNLLKATHAFFSFALTDRISGLHIERLSSLSSRIALLCRYMRPFTRALAVEAAVITSPTIRHRLSSRAQCDVALWRAFLLLLRLGAPAVVRPISSFRHDPPAVLMRYDASLHTVAVGVYEMHGTEERLLSFAALPLPFPVSSDSSRQNTCEYLAVVLGLLLLRLLGRTAFAYALYGDSISSLTWAMEDRAASAVARRANLAMVTLSVHLGARASSMHHVPGTLNVVYDGLSRGKSAQEVGLDPALQLWCDLPNHPIRRYLSLCDPSLPLEAAPDVFALIGELSQILNSLPHPSSPSHR